MGMYELVALETRGLVGLVRLNRPQALNALNNQMLRELMDSLAAFDSSDHIGAMVITGDERAFAAGADIKEMAQASAVEMLQSEQIAQFDRIHQIKKPVIAAVSGWCLGGGNELALSCDMIVASETSAFWSARDKYWGYPRCRWNAEAGARSWQGDRDGDGFEQPNTDRDRSSAVRSGQSSCPSRELSG